MTPFSTFFTQHYGERVCLVGLGNPDYGDDGFGVRLAQELKKAGIPDVVNGGTSPEQCLGRIASREFDHVVFLDAADFGASPGSLVVLGAEQIRMQFPQISTHKISLAVLADLIEAHGEAKVWLLGVQPESIKPGTSLTPTLRKTLDIVKDLLLEVAIPEQTPAPGRHRHFMEEHVC